MRKKCPKVLKVIIYPTIAEIHSFLLLNMYEIYVHLIFHFRVQTKTNFNLFVSVCLSVCVSQGYPTPRLVCPKDVRLEVPPYETTVSYHIPRPKTDVDFARDVAVEPLWAKEGELKLKPGSRNITFTAKHPLSKLTISCAFQINVLGEWLSF
jgi:hypothetical protein